MTIAEKVKSICKERKIAISRLERDCGFSNGYISSLKRGAPSYERLLVISEYLGVPVSDLTEKEETPAPLSAEVPAGYYELSDADRAIVNSLIERLNARSRQ